MSKIAFGINNLTLLASIAIGIAQGAQADEPKRIPPYKIPETIPYHGLESIHNLDAWIGGFSAARPTNAAPGTAAEIRDQLLEAFEASTTGKDLFAKILALNLNQNYAAPQSYANLARGIFLARLALRGEPNENRLAFVSSKRKAATLLLEVLFEETLYAGATLFPGQIPTATDHYFSYVNPNQSTEGCEAEGKKKTATLHGVEICQGDVLASKGGALSSSLLSRITTYPGQFSHSTTVYVSNDPLKPSFQLPEAEIEDGVKLRDPAKDYVQARKKKLYIYRANSAKPEARPSLLQKAVRGVDAYKAEMDRLSGNDPENKASFQYDFAFDGRDPSQQFCSEVVYDAYNRADLKHDLNAYPEKLWSTVASGTGDRVIEDLFKKGLSVPNISFPSPSDIERNSNFELIAAQIDATRIADDRIDSAIVDALIEYLKVNTDVLVGFFESVKDLGTKPLTPADIQKLKDLNLVDPKMVDALIKQVPENANVKQVIFFGFIDKVLGNRESTSSLRGALYAWHAQQAAKKRLVGLYELRKQVVTIAKQGAALAAAKTQAPLLQSELNGLSENLKALVNAKTGATPPRGANAIPRASRRFRPGGGGGHYAPGGGHFAPPPRPIGQ